MPHTLLIADAEPHPVVRDAIVGQIFPNLKIRYHTYPPDDDISCFYRKMASAIKKVDTPYVMLADNDDFLAASGIELGLEWLRNHPDYVSCGGAVMGFRLQTAAGLLNQVLGDVHSINVKYNANYNNVDLSSDDPRNRVHDGYNKSTLYYQIARKEAIATIFSEIEKLNMTFLPLYEAFFDMRMLSLGKVRVNHAFYTYIRQHGTSFGSSGADKLGQLIHSDFSGDLANIASLLAEELRQYGENDRVAIETMTREIFRPRLQSILRRDRNLRNGLERRLAAVIRSLRPLMSFRPSSLLFLDKRKVASHVRAHGAQDAYISALHDEFRQIEFTLRDRELMGILSNISQTT